jgi:hypothetical protein
MNDLSDYLDQALLATANGKHRKPDRKLTAFFPVKGNRATGELMVVGRAVNGWGKGWAPVEALDADKRREIIRDVSSPAWAADCCPMSWVQTSWHKTGFNCVECGEPHPAKGPRCSQCGTGEIQKVYNTATSAFWRVIRSVTHALNVADTTQPDWPSYLIWSDLYKVSPAKGGNPTSGQIKLQHDYCVRMLEEEIRQWAPRRILFLTGVDWAKPFFAGIGLRNGNELSGLVSYAGRADFGKGVASLVVAPHPQGKPEGQIVAEVEKAFADLGA